MLHGAMAISSLVPGHPNCQCGGHRSSLGGAAGFLGLATWWNGGAVPGGLTKGHLVRQISFSGL